jgi:hypothetical protein
MATDLGEDMLDLIAHILNGADRVGRYVSQVDAGHRI